MLKRLLLLPVTLFWWMVEEAFDVAIALALILGTIWLTNRWPNSALLFPTALVAILVWFGFRVFRKRNQ